MKTAEMRMGVAQQFHAILFGTGECLFMAMDHACRVFFHGAQSDEALALQSSGQYRER